MRFITDKKKPRGNAPGLFTVLMVDLTRFELVTSRLSAGRSNQLSYRSISLGGMVAGLARWFWFAARTVLRKTKATLSGLLCVRNSRQTKTISPAQRPWGPKVFKKAVGAQCADRRYMGSDNFCQLGPLTRLGDPLACRCRRPNRQGFLRGQSRLLWLRLRASPWRPSCGLRRRCGRCRRRSSS